MSKRISTRTYCNDIAPGTFSTELSRCTTYAEIVNSGTLTIVPEPALSYTDTKRCTAQDDLTTAGRDVVVHIKNNSSNAATTAGKITLYITGMNGAVYGSSISNLTSAPNVQTVTLSSANEQTITVKVDSNQWISFGFSSPAKKYCQKCYNYTIDRDSIYLIPWQFGIYYEPMFWSNSTETNYDSTYNLYSYYVEDLTKEVYIFLAQKSQVKTSQNVYIKRIQKGTPASGGIGTLGTLTGATLKNIKIKGVTYLTTETTLAPFYAAGNEYLVASIPLGGGSGNSLDRSALADVREASGTMTTSTDRGNGQVINNTINCSFYFDEACTEQTYSPLLVGGGNLDIEDIYLELYAANIVNINIKSIQFDTTNLGEWVKESTKNPDKNTYTCYKSNSNKGQASSLSKARITFKGYSSITFYIRSYAERYYDYCVLSKQGTALPSYLTTNYPGGSSSTVPTTYIKANTKNIAGSSSYSPVGTYWTSVSYDNLNTSTQYFIEVGYCKDSSGNSYDDCGYILLPKPDNEYNPPAATARDIYIYFCFKHYTFYRIKFDFQGGYVYLCKSDRSIINDTAVLALEYTINDLGTYHDPNTGEYSSAYGKMLGKCLWTNQSADSYSINMQYDILTSVTGNNSYQWSAGYDCTPRRLSYAPLSKAKYGRDGSIMALGNEIWYVVISIDGGLTLL